LSGAASIQRATAAGRGPGARPSLPLHNGEQMATAMAAILDERQAWKAAGRVVVFTNGCFDLLHPGHVALFEAARAEGDVLVVGLNSDRSVRALKGEGRPLIPEHERAETIGALEAVDRVVVYDEETPRAVIAALRPDVLVKGADWALDAIVGREEVEAGGGRVVRVELLPGRSTTSMVSRIRRP
jgi:rfaE bifunctional protein nucleotidyltransferase chain/domain